MQEKMKILFLTDHLEGNDGWSRYSLDIIEELQQQGHIVEVLVFKGSQQKNIKEQVVLLRPSRYYAHLWRVWRQSKKVNKIVKNFKPNIIHFVVEPYAHMLPFLETRGIQTVLTVHGTYAHIPSVMDSCLKRINASFMTFFMYLKVSHVISVSSYTAKYLVQKLTFLFRKKVTNKLTVVTNGVCLESFSDSSKKNISKEKKKILFVGGIKARKGILEALKAFAVLREQFPSVIIEYVFVGAFKEESSYWTAIKKNIQEYNLKDSVVFTGKINKEYLVQHYLEADVFMMLSVRSKNTFEGFGLTYLEANAYGIPTIGSIDSGAQEAIKDGQTGYLVDPYDSRQVVDRLVNVIIEHRIKSDNCRKWAEENSIKIKVDEIIKIYKKLISDEK